jgi:hypothetical protein
VEERCVAQKDVSKKRRIFECLLLVAVFTTNLLNKTAYGWRHVPLLGVA